MSNPANRLPPEYDETLPKDYDPEYTSNISTRMRVPDKIAMRDDEEENRINFEYTRFNMDEQHRVAAMSVPDKIVVAGQEQSVGVSEPQLHLDLNMASGFSTQDAYVGLQTPPRVLTLDERPFPNVNSASGDQRGVEYNNDDEILSVEQQKEMNVSFQETAMNGYIPQTPPRSQSLEITEGALLATPGEGLLIQGDQDDELVQVKRQVAKLHRHIQRLDDENRKRSQREILILYPAVFGYLLFQIAKWFMKPH